MSVCLVDAIKLFHIATPTVCLGSSWKLTHDLCANMQKMQQIFKVLILKFLANILSFKLTGELGQQASSSYVRIYYGTVRLMI